MLHTSTVDSNTISVLKELLALPILKDFTLKEMIENHQKRYPNQMLLISIPQALVFFEDAEKSENPISLNEQTWKNVQRIIKQKVNEYLS